MRKILLVIVSLGTAIIIGFGGCSGGGKKDETPIIEEHNTNGGQDDAGSVSNEGGPAGGSPIGSGGTTTQTPPSGTDITVADRGAGADAAALGQDDKNGGNEGTGEAEGEGVDEGEGDSGETIAPISNNANLSGLALSAGNLAPVFNSDTTNYSIPVHFLVDKTTILTNASDPDATVSINGISVNRGGPLPQFSLVEGANTFTIAVTAPDGETRKNYIVTVNREGISREGVAGFKQRALLRASNAGIVDSFGFSAALSGNTLIVGANEEDSNFRGVVRQGEVDNNRANNSGASYIFVREGGNWRQDAHLKASNTDAGDNFGRSVDVSGDIAVVGAPHEASGARGVFGAGADGAAEADNTISYSGAAYIFVREGGIWRQEAYLKASNTGSFDYFGRSVAASGNTVIIGAVNEDSAARGVNGNRDDNSLADSGAAFVFVKENGAWREEAYLKASNSRERSLFGFSVDIDGDTAIIGAPGRGGAAYVFVREDGNWREQSYIRGTNTILGDQFGASVAISENLVAVGSPKENSAATGVNNFETDMNGDGVDDYAFHSGAAYVFERERNAWQQRAYFKASNTGADDEFGRDVDISGNDLIVGAWHEQSSVGGINQGGADDALNYSGASYIFVRDGGVWSQKMFLKALSPGENDLFGNSVTISGDTVAIGAYAEGNAASGVFGAVYVFW